VTISDEEQADVVDHLLAEYRLTLQEDRRALFDRFTEVDGYIGKGPAFAAAIGRFARAYADQNDRDHAQLVKAIDAGRVPR
jgi:hypothetical protein